MSLPRVSNRARDHHSDRQPCTDSWPELFWSSRRTAAREQTLQGLLGGHARWTLAPWPEAAERLCGTHGNDVLWVLEPNAGEGPTPEALAESLARGIGRPLTLVLLPEAWMHDSVRWLNAGADRCMAATSPPPLLEAMLQALLRRCKGMTTNVSVFGPLRFDHVSQTLFHGDRRIWLTCRETQVAALLFRSGLQRIHALEVLKALGAADAETNNKALVALYVHRVNRKIRPHGVQIDAVRGFGYSLRLIAPELTPAKVDRASENGLTQWFRTAHRSAPSEPHVLP